MPIFSGNSGQLIYRVVDLTFDSLSKSAASGTRDRITYPVGNRFNQFSSEQND